MIKELREQEELWSLFTRQEEYDQPYRDMHDRFPYYMSRDRDLMDPKVSRFLLDHGMKTDYGEEKTFALCLTHDIDTIYPSWPGAMKDSARSLARGDIKKGIVAPFARLKKSWNPIWNFKETIALEKKYGAVSTFFFLTTLRDPYEAVYAIGDLKDELGMLKDSEFEIGLHGGYYSYDSLESIISEKLALEQAAGGKVIGYRNHYLRFKVPETWNLLKKSGFKYDTTMGYSDCMGFRNGMCHPFRPFDLHTNEWIDLIEIPMAVMANTPFNSMALDYSRSWSMIKDLIDTVEKHRGVITINWHNTQMSGDYGKLYEKILQYGSEKGALMTSAENIYRMAPTL